MTLKTVQKTKQYYIWSLKTYTHGDKHNFVPYVKDAHFFVVDQILCLWVLLFCMLSLIIIIKVFAL